MVKNQSFRRVFVCHRHKPDKQLADSNCLGEGVCFGQSYSERRVPKDTKHIHKMVERSSHDPSADPAADLAVTPCSAHSALQLLSTSSRLLRLALDSVPPVKSPCDIFLMWVQPLSID